MQTGHALGALLSAERAGAQHATACERYWPGRAKAKGERMQKDGYRTAHFVDGTWWLAAEAAIWTARQLQRCAAHCHPSVGQAALLGRRDARVEPVCRQGVAVDALCAHKAAAAPRRQARLFGLRRRPRAVATLRAGRPGGRVALQGEMQASVSECAARQAGWKAVRHENR